MQSSYPVPSGNATLPLLLKLLTSNQKQRHHIYIIHNIPIFNSRSNAIWLGLCKQTTLWLSSTLESIRKLCIIFLIDSRQGTPTPTRKESEGTFPVYVKSRGFSDPLNCQICNALLLVLSSLTRKETFPGKSFFRLEQNLSRYLHILCLHISSFLVIFNNVQGNNNEDDDPFFAAISIINI